MSEVRELVLPIESSEAPNLDGSLLFIGTATVLLRFAGFTILTDPNFLHQGDRVHLGYGITSARQTNPALEIEQLPPLDFVVLSHMHDDHFDSVAAAKLDKSLPIITTHHAAADLKKKGFTAPHALQTWEKLRVTKGNASVQVTAMPGRHGPAILSAVLPPVMGSMLEFQFDSVVFRLYITGDTLIYDDLREIPQRYPDINLALLHLGGTKVFGVLLTMDATQGVQAIQIIAPQLSIPIHYNDYTVFKSPLADFMHAVEDAGLSDRVHYLSHGETYNFHL
ncbi:MBL fold metallo-hydrolase [Chroococcidiopsis sp. TS-821]|uniref:MBL fold metallo-hydrolase n=1 Tax=Chroococcidiopsis sp. TS-821 TaxID=1378066 RepID=UPI000CEEBF9E|nr:MBL fold metallo-hydrolase [Chroococcidiopsis sp. TS-821]PPS39644.1 MBL fold metallo-hydrolase [Chroococcidiopsis sp. TS-821]